MFITALWPPWSSSQFHVVCVIYMTKSTVAVMEKSHHHLGLFVCLFVCIWRNIHVSYFDNQAL